MTQAKNGDTVSIHYTGKLPDGTPFDSSEGRDPLEFKLGEGQVINGFEQAVEGMSQGESKTFEVPADQAYGQRLDELVHEVPKDRLPPDIEVQEGMQLQAVGPNEQPVLLTVAEVGDETVKLDANHPLAGQDLTFEVELVEIK